MSAAAGRWDDLAVRLGSGAAVALVGLAAVWLGGVAFMALVVAACGVMTWELVRMLDPEAPAVRLAALAAAALLAGILLPPGFALPLLFAPSLAGLGQLYQRRTSYLTFTAAIMVAGFGLFFLRDTYGVFWMFWLVTVVIVTDVAGYFAGRFIGGPKFWPRVSPKKTWSGTAAGWIAAGLTGLIFAWETTASLQLIGISVAASMASQIGDIAESAVKRRSGVKDSSTLLPGHGGLFDRFDGMLGASIFLLLTGQFVDFPPGLS